MSSKKPTLLMLMGLPGSGKTTFAKHFAKTHDFIHLNSDRLRLGIFYNPSYDELEHKIVYDALDEILNDLLNEGRNVIYDANLNRREHRDQKYEIAKKHRAQVLTCYFSVPEKLALERLAVRRHEIPKNKWRATPEEVYRHIKSGLEIPQEDEPAITLKGIHDTKLQESQVLDTLLNTHL